MRSEDLWRFAMKVGVSSWFSNTREFEERTSGGDFTRDFSVSDADQLHRELELVSIVEPLGYDSFWTIEHHFTPYGMTGNPTQLLSYVAAQTSRIELGTMVLVLPWHDPIRLAENLAILDILLDGRKLNIGIGRGFAAREFNAFRVPYHESRERLIECVEVLRMALNEEFFEFSGKHFSIPRTSIRPRPLHANLCENLLMAWSSTESLEIAAKIGAAPLFANYRGWEALTEHLEAFNDIRAAHGLERLGSTVAVTVHVDRDHERAVEIGQRHWQRTSKMTMWHYDRLAADHFLPAATPEERDRIVRAGWENQASSGIFGSPEAVTEQLLQLKSRANIEHLITLQSFGDLPLAAASGSMELFAEEVMPNLRGVT